MEKVIDIKNISKQYFWEKKYKGFFGIFKSIIKPQFKTVMALDDVSLEINQGEIVGLLGPNGAGKSTLFKCMTGILKTDSGNVSVLNKEAWSDRKEIVPQIGAFFGNKGLMWWNLPVIKSYELIKDLYHISNEDFNKRLNFFIEIIGNREYLEKPPRQLSYGQRQRAEIITCLLHNPKIVFLDEPTLGMDIVAKEQLSKIILECNKVYGTTFIISTHDLKDIEKMCSKIVIINKGKIVKNSDANSVKLELLKQYIIEIDFYEDVNLDMFLSLNIQAKVITNRRIMISVDSTDINIFDLLQKINEVLKIATFQIDYQTIEDVIKQYYI